MAKFFINYASYQTASNVFDKPLYYSVDYPTSNTDVYDDSLKHTSNYDISSQRYDTIDDYYMIEVCTEQQICFDIFNDFTKHNSPRESYE